MKHRYKLYCLHCEMPTASEKRAVQLGLEKQYGATTRVHACYLCGHVRPISQKRRRA